MSSFSQVSVIPAMSMHLFWHSASSSSILLVTDRALAHRMLGNSIYLLGCELDCSCCYPGVQLVYKHKVLVHCMSTPVLATWLVALFLCEWVALQVFLLFSMF